MADRVIERTETEKAPERETVVVHEDQRDAPRGSNGLIVAVIVLMVILLLLFFGSRLFGGGDGGGSTPDINVQTPAPTTNQ